MKAMWIIKFFDKLEDRVRGFFSHYPIAYGFMAGIGAVLFWRGVWHSVDAFHLFLSYYHRDLSIDWVAVPWWDGPLSFVVGSFLLLMTGTFVSSFIGNEIIISGLRGEKKLTEKTENELRMEVGAIAEIKEHVEQISARLKELEEGKDKTH